MSWRDKLNGKPHPNRAWQRGQGWLVKDLVEARQFLKDVKCDYFTRKSAPTVKVPIAKASDEEIRTILKKLGVKIGSVFVGEGADIVDINGRKIESGESSDDPT